MICVVEADEPEPEDDVGGCIILLLPINTIIMLSRDDEGGGQLHQKFERQQTWM
jgi:hypothetical protein